MDLPASRRIAVLALALALAGCVARSPGLTPGYVPRDALGQPALAEIGKRYS